MRSKALRTRFRASLGGCRAYEVLRCQLRNNLGHPVCICAFSLTFRETSLPARARMPSIPRVTNQNDRIARYAGFTPIINLQECSVGRCRSL